MDFHVITHRGAELVMQVVDGRPVFPPLALPRASATLDSPENEEGGRLSRQLEFLAKVLPTHSTTP